MTNTWSNEKISPFCWCLTRAECWIVCDYLLCEMEDKKTSFTSQIYYSHGEVQNIYLKCQKNSIIYFITEYTSALWTKQPVLSLEAKNKKATGGKKSVLYVYVDGDFGLIQADLAKSSDKQVVTLTKNSSLLHNTNLQTLNYNHISFFLCLLYFVKPGFEVNINQYHSLRPQTLVQNWINTSLTQCQQKQSFTKTGLFVVLAYCIILHMWTQ